MSTEPVTDLDHARHDRDAWIESALQAQKRVVELEAEVARLRKGVEDYRAGNYADPRSHRPQPCPHGLRHWQECEACNDAALVAILRNAPPDQP